MQPEQPSTLPPTSADAAALEHARKLAEVDNQMKRRAGLLRDLAEAYFARSGEE